MRKLRSGKCGPAPLGLRHRQLLVIGNDAGCTGMRKDWPVCQEMREAFERHQQVDVLDFDIGPGLEPERSEVEDSFYSSGYHSVESGLSRPDWHGNRYHTH